MKITINGLMKSGVVFVGVMLAATFMFVSVGARSDAGDFDAAGTYKTKCVACHGARAEKKFNTTLSEGDLLQAVLKGKKSEKPPNMPAFAERGITVDQGNALVVYMKSIR